MKRIVKDGFQKIRWGLLGLLLCFYLSFFIRLLVPATAMVTEIAEKSLQVLSTMLLMNGLTAAGDMNPLFFKARKWVAVQMGMYAVYLLINGVYAALSSRELLAEQAQILYAWLFLASTLCGSVVLRLAQWLGIRGLLKGLSAVWLDCGGEEKAVGRGKRLNKLLGVCYALLLVSIALLACFALDVGFNIAAISAQNGFTDIQLRMLASGILGLAIVFILHFIALIGVIRYTRQVEKRVKALCE